MSTPTPGDRITVTSPEGERYFVSVLIARPVAEGVVVTGAVQQPRAWRGKVVTTRIPAQREAQRQEAGQ